jgi:hypothetical protein
VARVRPALQEKITRYRRECFRVLWRAFQADALSALGQRFDRRSAREWCRRPTAQDHAAAPDGAGARGAVGARPFDTMRVERASGPPPSWSVSTSMMPENRCAFHVALIPTLVSR